MAYLLDTSVLGRMANVNDAKHGTANRAVVELHRRGETLHVSPQVMIEFRGMATRPVAVNGLGLTIAETESLSAMYLARFSLLSETPDIFPAWQAIVEKLGVIGKQVHDARHVAVCEVHAITHVLTFNVVHFARLAASGSSIDVVDPKDI